MPITVAPLKVFIGWDSREKIAYDVLRHSVIRWANNTPVEIVPLVHKELRKQGWFKRPWITDAETGNFIDTVDGKPFSTEFSHTRFLVPALNGYKGWALFMDADMVFTDNIRKLFKLCDNKYAAMCVKHNHNPPEGMKMDDVPQSRYFRKNWSSFVLFNCGHPSNRKLTPELVNMAAGGYLHKFGWLRDSEIGALPPEYNWIESVSKSTIKPAVIHYTDGGPWFDNYKHVSHADKWWEMYDEFMKSGDYQPVKETISVKYGEHR